MKQMKLIAEKSLSIVVPVYNEGSIIEEFTRDYYREIFQGFSDAEFIIVDDCSSDKTPRILDRLKEELPITVFRLPTNQGHGKALRFGLDRASKDIIFYTDSDYQHAPEDFWKLYENLDGNDLVLGFRQQRRDSFFRLVLTRLVRMTVAAFFGLNIRDINIPFRLYKKEPLKKALALVDKEALIPSILIVLALFRSGGKIKEIPVRHYARKFGQGSLVSWKLLRFCYRAFIDLLAFKRKMGGPRF